MKIAARLGWAACVLTLALTCNRASATLLPDHTNLYGASTLAQAASDPASSGTQLATETVALAPITYPDSTDVGFLTSTVIQNDALNPFVDGGGAYGPGVPGALTFVFTLSNTGTIENGDFAFTQISLNGFAGFSVDASYLYSSAPDYVTPDIVGRSKAGTPISVSYANDNVLPSDGTNVLGLGLTSMEIVLNTNATSYSSVFDPVIGGSTTYGASYQPTPEPCGAILLLIGMATLGLAGWRRHFRPQA